VIVKKINVFKQPLSANICDQMLREVARTDTWTMAHVTMNPGAYSLLHKHRKMDEVYIVTKGFGVLKVAGMCYELRAGSVVRINAGAPHQFFNTGATALEHLVLADPPFDPSDVVVLEPELDTLERNEVTRLKLPEMIECFDGAKIMGYEFSNLDLSFAFGWSINDLARHKQPHYHKKTTEWIYIVEGKGTIETESLDFKTQTRWIEPGDWIEIPAGESHALRNYREQALVSGEVRRTNHDEYLVVLCMCEPKFDMSDVHYR
jgi:mannose-6-phosphate isomerase-like protein (cupin superfamily)